MANSQKYKGTGLTNSGVKELKPTYGFPIMKIMIKETPILINLETQISNLGRPFRMFGTRVNNEMPERWVNKVLKYHWVFEFKYLDEKGGYFDVEIDYNDNFYKLTKK